MITFKVLICMILYIERQLLFTLFLQSFLIIFMKSLKIWSLELGYAKGWRVTGFFFHVFKTIFIVSKRRGWSVDLVGISSVRLIIYLTTIDDGFISIPFIDLEILSIQWIRSGVEVPMLQVPTEQVPCKTIGISNLHFAFHMHMLKNA